MIKTSITHDALTRALVRQQRWFEQHGREDAFVDASPAVAGPEKRRMAKAVLRRPPTGREAFAAYRAILRDSRKP